MRQTRCRLVGRDLPSFLRTVVRRTALYRWGFAGLTTAGVDTALRKRGKFVLTDHHTEIRGHVQDSCGFNGRSYDD